MCKNTNREDRAPKTVNKYLSYIVSMCFSFGLDAAAPQEAVEDEEEEESPNYEEKAQEIVQSILQEVVNTVAGGEILLFPGELKLKLFSVTQSESLFFGQCSCLFGTMLNPKLIVHFIAKCKTQCKTDPMQIQ